MLEIVELKKKTVFAVVNYFWNTADIGRDERYLHLLTEFLALGVLMGLRSRGSSARAQADEEMIGL